MPVPGIEKNLGTLLEKAVAEQGEKMLLHIDPAGMTLSYRQFNDLVNRAANVLTTGRSCCRNAAELSGIPGRLARPGQNWGCNGARK